jgi:hypothetical protein
MGTNETSINAQQAVGHLHRPKSGVDDRALLAVVKCRHLEGEQIHRRRDLDHSAGRVARHKLAERALDLAARRVADPDDADDSREDRDVGGGGGIAVLLARENVLDQAAGHEHLRAEAGACDELEPGRDQQLAAGRAIHERNRAQHEPGEIPQTPLPGGRKGVVEAEFTPGRLIRPARFGRV